jgi:hypothetical protein
MLFSVQREKSIKKRQQQDDENEKVRGDGDDNIEEKGDYILVPLSTHDQIYKFRSIEKSRHKQATLNT